MFVCLICLTTLQSLLDTVVAIGMMISPPIGGALYEVRQRPLHDIIKLRHPSHGSISIPAAAMFVTLEVLRFFADIMQLVDCCALQYCCSWEVFRFLSSALVQFSV